MGNIILISDKRKPQSWTHFSSLDLKMYLTQIIRRNQPLWNLNFITQLKVSHNITVIENVESL